MFVASNCSASESLHIVIVIVALSNWMLHYSCVINSPQMHTLAVRLWRVVFYWFHVTNVLVRCSAHSSSIVVCLLTLSSCNVQALSHVLATLYGLAVATVNERFLSRLRH